MSAAFGRDVGNVRVHDGPAAAATARAFGAKAFTAGRDIVFSAGRYAPGTPDGDHLLAHELAHVVQQDSPGRSGTAAAEARAAHAATEVTAGRAAPPATVGAAAPGLQLEPDPAAKRPRLLDPLPALHLNLKTLDAFDHGSAELTPAHLDRIRFVAELFGQMFLTAPGSVLLITGHTDRTGDEARNVGLGARRAAAVAAALIRAGVAAAAIRTDSAGMRDPVVDTPGKEPRNRRVEIRVDPPAVPSPLGALAPAPLKPTLVPDPKGLAVPPARPPWLAPVPITPTPTPKGIEGPSRSGSAGDLAGAVQKLPEVKRIIDALKNMSEADWHRLTPAEKTIVITQGALITAGAAAGVASDPAARKTALDALDGQEIPIPFTGGVMKLVPKTKDPGGLIRIDVLKIFDPKR